MPGRFKALVDKALQPGFAYKYHQYGQFWNKLLAGRSAEVLLTCDAPGWYDRFVYGRPARNQVK
jgi:putative NADPH-quinone reductase